MSQAASQAAAFYRDVSRDGRLWTIKDDGGFPAPVTPSGRAMPFWSSRSRAERIVAAVPAYKSFVVVEVTWDEFRDRWLPGLERDGLRVGVNWSGSKAVGYDLLPSEVRRVVEAAFSRVHGEDEP